MSKTDDSTRRPAKGPRIALAQVSPALGDVAANLEEHREAVAKAVADGCDLLVFPELSLAGYRLKDSVADVAIRRGSDAWKAMEALSAELCVVVGFVEETADHRFYNSAAWLEGGKCLAVHRKTYLPTYGMFDEQRYFARGSGVAAFDTKLGRVAMLVCEDMLHPSAVTIAACDGATLLVVPSASPAKGIGAEGEADANARDWEQYLHVMARSFGLWIAYCNRVGVEDGVSFWGGAEIVSPAGERLVKAAYYDEDQVSGVLSDDAVRRRRLASPLVRDEDLDLTINELSRIRGRAVVAPAESEAAPARAPRYGGDRREGGEGRYGGDRRDGGFGGDRREGGAGRFGGDRREGGFGGDRRDGGAGRFGGDRREGGEGRFGGDRREGGAGRFGGDRREGGEGRFGGDRREGGEGRSDGDKPPRRFGGAPRPAGGEGWRGRPPRQRDDAGPDRGPDRDAPRPFRPRGPYQERGGRGRGAGDDRPAFGGPPRPRFGEERGRPPFGGAPRGFGPRGGFGRGDDAGGPPRGRGGFGPGARGGDEAPRPRDRERPEPGRAPFG